MASKVESPMGDPHVVSLRYRVEHSKGVSFEEDSQPIEGEFESFRLRVFPHSATAQMKKHYATKDEARMVVEEFLRPWEIYDAVRPGGTGLTFIFEDAEIIDRDPPPAYITVEL